MKNRFFIPFCFFTFSTFSAFAETVDYNDPEKYPEYYANSAALREIGADKAYTGESGDAYSGFSGSGVTVAVVDAGTSSSHSDLINQISSLIKPELNIFASKHGTHVAGIIAAEKNNEGMHGVAYRAKLLTFSTLLGDGCDNPEICANPADVWNMLADSEYDSVKIINNSWGASEGDIDQETWDRLYHLTTQMVNKDKLIIAAAGNETQLNPSSFPAGAAVRNPLFKNNVINVVAYDATKSRSSKELIAPFSNLAGNAREWTLAAPGVDIYSSVLYDKAAEPPVEKFKLMSGTSMAAPMVSGAAALVQEAFPYLGGKQIADVLFSTAKKKEELPELSPYMIQLGANQTRFLFFTDNAQGKTYEQALAESGHSCGVSGSCHKVTFKDVFGQGLLNVEAAVKGIKSFDANRLTAADYDVSMKQFLYSIDTLGNASTWSNGINQIRSENEQYAQADVGLRKQGEGVLTLAGANTFLGTSVVNGGELVLTGSMLGDVIVNAGTFTLSESGRMDGKITIKEDGVLTIDADLGKFSDLENNGTVWAVKGTSIGEVVNNGTFSVIGVSDGENISSGNFSSNENGTFTNKGNLNFEKGGKFNGDLDNEGLVSIVGDSYMNGQFNNKSSGNVFVNSDVRIELPGGYINNEGVLSGFGAIDGSVVNNASGSVATSLSHIMELNSSGNILLTSAADGSGAATLSVHTLNITGGDFKITPGTVAFENGQRYTVIKFSNLDGFSGFASQSYLSDFIVATPHQEPDRIDLEINFLRMSEAGASDSFLPEEKKVLEIMDTLYLDKNMTDVKGYYYLSKESLQKEVNIIRQKAKPMEKEVLPLTNVMSAHISSHLFKTSINRDAAAFHRGFQRGYTPMQRYRGGYYYRGRSGGNTSASGNKVWGQVLGGRVVEDKDDSLNKGETKTKTIGGMFGYDHEFSPRLLVGWTAGFASGRLTQDSDEINIKDYRAGIYTGSRFGKVTLNSILMAGFQQYNSSRMTEVVGSEAIARSEFNGYSAEFDLNLGYDFMRLPYRDYSFYLRSYLAANVSYISQDAYEEKGSSSLLLGVDSVDNTSVSIHPGITLGYTFSQAVLTADVGYQRILSGDSVQTSAYFLADTAKTTFDSLPTETDKDYFTAGVGLKTNLTRNVELNLYAGTRISDRTEALNFAASLSYAF